MLDALRPGEIAHVHQAVDAFLDFDEGAKIGHIAHAALDHAAHAVAAVDGGPGVGFELFEAEGDAAVPGMHLQNHGFHLIAGPDHLGGVFHAPRPGHLADVDEAFHAAFEFHERAIIGDVDHAADDAAFHRVALQHRVPGVRLQLLDAQRNALLGAIELENLDGDVLAHLEHLRRMRDAASLSRWSIRAALACCAARRPRTSSARRQ